MASKNIPQYIGIIMDGNRRWAKERNLPTLMGHKKGYEKLKKVSQWCLKRKIKALSVFGFSTENWNRSKEEVSYLMRLFYNALTKDLQEFHRQNIRLVVSGRIEDFSPKIQRAIRQAMELTKNNKAGTLNLCISYGGRQEIAEACKKIVQKKIPAEKITEEIINQNLYVSGLPDPDLIIRTSGENRLSGFLLWQSAYSELLFVLKHWPDFEEEDLDEAIKEYGRRERRFGK